MFAIDFDWITYATTLTHGNSVQEFWFDMKEKRLIHFDYSRLLKNQYIVINFRNTDEKKLVAKAIPTISAQTLISIAGCCSYRLENMDLIFTRSAKIRYSRVFGDEQTINSSLIFQSDSFWCKIAYIMQECINLIYQQGLGGFLNLEIRTTPILHEMFDIPYQIDAGRAKEVYRNLKKESAMIHKQLRDKTIAKTRTGEKKSDDKAIQNLIHQQHKLEDKLIRFPQELFGTQQEKMYISSKFRSIGTDTFRISTYDANIQGFPKELRKCLLPRYGNKLIEYDITCSQLILLAGLAEEDRLIQCYLKDMDLYTFIFARMLGKPQDEITAEERSVYKTIVLQVLYGAGIDTIRTELLGVGCRLTNEEIRKFKRLFYKSFPAIKNYFEKVKAAEVVALPTGRKYVMKKIKPYARLSYILQYVEAEILRRILVDLYNRSLEMKFKMYLSIHDSVYIETSNNDIVNMRKSIQECFDQAVSTYFPHIKKIKVKEIMIYGKF